MIESVGASSTYDPAATSIELRSHRRGKAVRPASDGWRERMGIEPTKSLSPDPSPVLKTGPSTSNGHAPRSVGKSQDRTIRDETPSIQGKTPAGIHGGPSNRARRSHAGRGGFWSSVPGAHAPSYTTPPPSGAQIDTVEKTLSERQKSF